MIHLMIKKAYPTGLSYLCYTAVNDPYTYKGSGKRWLNHLRKHRPHIVTCVIGTYETLAELREAGIYYSKLYNVVEDDNWANLREEDGMGGGSGKVGRRWKIKDTSNMRGPKDRTSEKCIEGYKRVSENMKLNNPMFRDDMKQLLSKRMKGKFIGESNPYYGRKHSEETRSKMRGRRGPQLKTVSCIKCKIELSGANYTKHTRSCIDGIKYIANPLASCVKYKQEMTNNRIKTHRCINGRREKI